MLFLGLDQHHQGACAVARRRRLQARYRRRPVVDQADMHADDAVQPAQAIGQGPDRRARRRLAVGTSQEGRLHRGAHPVSLAGQRTAGRPQEAAERHAHALRPGRGVHDQMQVGRGIHGIDGRQFVQREIGQAGVLAIHIAAGPDDARHGQAFRHMLHRMPDVVFVVAGGIEAVEQRQKSGASQCHGHLERKGRGRLCVFRTGRATCAATRPPCLSRTRRCRCGNSPGAGL